MVKMILSAVVAMGLGSVAFAADTNTGAATAAPAAEKMAPATGTAAAAPAEMGATKSGKKSMNAKKAAKKNDTKAPKAE